MYTRFNDIMKQQCDNLHYLMDSGYAKSVSQVVDALLDALRAGNKVLIAGNGGSAADAQHFAGEFVGRFLRERGGFPAVALTTDSSIMTSVANDYGFDEIFARQINALGNEGDVFIGISTSGNSENIVNAFNECKQKGITTVGLLGKNGGKLKDMSDYLMLVPFKETPRVQEIHTMTVHMMCEIVEEKIIQEDIKK